MITKLQPVGFSGMHTLRLFNPQTSQDQRLLDELEKYYGEGRGGEFLEKCRHMLEKIIVRHNLTVTSGRNWLAKVMTNQDGGFTNNYLNYFAIGDDATPAAEGDTALGNELFRKAVSSSIDSTNTANISTFVGASEANFDWEEWGHFVDGTAVTDSGTMFSHHIDSSISKSSPNTVTVDSVYTLDDA